MHRVVEEQEDSLARSELVRVPSPVALLRRVSAEREPGPVAGSRGHRRQSEPNPVGVGHLQRAQSRAVSGLLRPGVVHVKIIDLRLEPADPGGPFGVRIGLQWPGAKPAGGLDLRRKIEPYADPRPGAVPAG
jgi:hypothetical protein